MLVATLKGGRERLRRAVKRAPKSSGRKISRPATYVPAGSSRGNGAERSTR
jgi:hypothetical protein